MATKSLAAAKQKGPLSEMSFKTRAAGKVGALHKALGIPEDQKIPTSKLLSEQKRLQAMAKGDKKLSASNLTRLHMIQAALRYRGA